MSGSGDQGGAGGLAAYLTPDGYGTDTLTEKRSRFIGQVWPVTNEAEARARIEETKKRYYDARHNCWCYLLRSGPVRYSDDGEPQGTAGQPMLNVFQSGEITDVCCVVTRYFGGVLLGAGGLVRAYSAAAKMALDAAGICRMANWQSILLSCDYSRYARVRRLLEEYESVIEDTDFGADVLISALLREDRAARFHAALDEMSAGGLRAEIVGQCFRGAGVG